MMQGKEKLSPRKAFLARIADRAVVLLRESDNPQQEMAWAEDRLEEANLWWGSLPDRKSPERWVQAVLEDNWNLLDQSVPWMLERDLRPESALSFHELISNLLPSEGGL